MSTTYNSHTAVNQLQRGGGQITLRGSTTVVTEFFAFAINSILYQRGVYPAESFQKVQRYGVPLFITQDIPLKSYLGSVLSQLSEWLMNGSVQKLVLVIGDQASGVNLERWVFDIDTQGGATAANNIITPSGAYNEKECQNQIAAMMRQISASVSFLPLMETSCNFDLLVYARADTSVPTTWENSDPKLIVDSTQVKLRSFTTSVHKVDTSVCFREAN